MAKVSDWIREFAAALIERSGRVDFPPWGSGYWEDFQTSLARIGATWDQADEASSVVCDVPGLFLDNYRPMVIEAVRKIQARAVLADKGVMPGSLDEARVQSRDCPDCGGTGGAVRYVHREILGKVRSFDGNAVPVGGSACYPCSCPLGRLVARGLRREGQDRDPLTVDQYPSLRMGPARWSDRDNRYRYRPSHWDGESGMPHGAGEVATPEQELSSLKRLVASLAASGASKGRIVPGHPGSPRQGDASGLPGPSGDRTDLATAAGDPVVARELAPAAPTRPMRPEDIRVPEDDLSAWF